MFSAHKYSPTWISLHKILLTALLTMTVLTGLVGAMMPSASAQASVNSQSNPIWSNTFSVPGYSMSGDSVTCGVESLQVQSGLAGTQLFGTVSSSQPINFWVMSNAEIHAWTSGWSAKGSPSHVCGSANPPTTQVRATMITSYSMTWTVPDSETYYFIFWNTGSGPSTVSFSYWSQ